MVTNYDERDKKLRMMKTKQSRKTTRKLNTLSKRGKLKKHVRDRVNDIKAIKSQGSRKRIHNIDEDWQTDRAAHFDSDQEDILPTDMLDADLDWENSAFAGVKRRKIEREQEEEKDELEAQKRRFEGQLQEDEIELLPIKLPDGRLVRPKQKKPKKESAEEEGDEKDEESEEKEEKVDPLAGLSAAEMIVKRRELLEEQKQAISSMGLALQADPQTNIFKLRDLYTVCTGQGVHSIIRESVQKLAIASFVQVLCDIIPGYAIRPLSEAEQQQKVKKDTKKLQTYEEALLRYHLKFLQLCEKNCKRLESGVNEATFGYKIGQLSMKALCRILLTVPHFNYATNIVTALMRTIMQKHKETTLEICDTIAALFKQDIHFKMSLFTVKAIHGIVKEKVVSVPPQLLRTFLSLKINKVANDDKKSEKNFILSKKQRLQKERQSKSKKKYDKQLHKLESDLKEVEASESLSNKLKTATETMKQVFHIYFAVIKRVPSHALLEPVLEGLSKFAHLLNVEFFADMIKCMEALVDERQLRVLDSLHCIHTVFIILSGDGQSLNVDPYKFYKSMYRLLSVLPFEKDPVLRLRNVAMATRCLEIMLNGRRKQVPLSRVGAFVRRLLLTAVVLDDASALPLVAITRSVFVAHPKVAKLVENVEEDEGGVGGSSMYRPDFEDPDSSAAMTTDAFPELNRLAKRRHTTISHIARNILHAIPSTGPHRLDPAILARKPWEYAVEEEEATEGKNGKQQQEPGAFQAIHSLAKKQKVNLSQGNLYTYVLRWLENPNVK